MAKLKKPKTLAEQIAERNDPAPQDFDPEELPDQDHDSGDWSSNDDISEAALDGREHYVEVEKSKLRKQNVVSLGPRYEGSRVSREAVIAEDSDDDPFAKGFEEGDSEEASELENRHSRSNGIDGVNGGYAVGGTDGSDIESRSGYHDNELEDQSRGSSSGSRTSDDESDEDMDQRVPASKASEGVDRAELRRLMREEQRSVAANISQAVRADVEKGKAVKSQRALFDSLLNTRIKLQKGLIGVNSFEGATWPSDDKSSEAVRAAETAALNLLDSLDGLRHTLREHRTGEKRKRRTFSDNAETEAIWGQLQADDAESLPLWNATLNKWSAKTRGVASLSTSRRLNNTHTQQTLVNVLTSDLADTARLIKRTRVPRSCAPVQVAMGVAESRHIYDDADFYGLLLKELLERRGQDSAAEFTPHWQAAREAKTKKVVDTRASKGRKLRYTVHEKLQNFMAPEDRCTWGERQIDELFSGLFGQRRPLAEDGDEDADGVEDELKDSAETGLLLFGR